MATRETDPRVGHFFDGHRPHHRPAAQPEALPREPLAAREGRSVGGCPSPKQPIVFWLDKNIPPVYRQAVTDGILEVEQGLRAHRLQERHRREAAARRRRLRHAGRAPRLDPLVRRRRRRLRARPQHTDPRTGEIIDADIAMSDVFGRGAWRFRVETWAAGPRSPRRRAAVRAGARPRPAITPTEARAEFGFAMDLLEARGEIRTARGRGLRRRRWCATPSRTRSATRSA